MAKQSSQKFIARNRAPRVQIEYDVELYGSEKKVQLPFIMGVLADLSGKPKEPLPALEDRKMLEIDVDNFDERMRSMAPRAAFSVPNTLTGDGNLQVDLTFERLSDFSPAAVASKIGPLAKLLAARRELATLMAYMDGKSGAEDLIQNLMENPAWLKALAASKEAVAPEALAALEREVAAEKGVSPASQPETAAAESRTEAPAPSAPEEEIEPIIEARSDTVEALNVVAPGPAEVAAAQEAVPEKVAKEPAVLQKTAPDLTASEPVAPEEIVPEEAAPEQAAPEQAALGADVESSGEDAGALSAGLEEPAPLVEGAEDDLDALLGDAPEPEVAAEVPTPEDLEILEAESLAEESLDELDALLEEEPAEPEAQEDLIAEESLASDDLDTLLDDTPAPEVAAEAPATDDREILEAESSVEEPLDDLDSLLEEEPTEPDEHEDLIAEESVASDDLDALLDDTPEPEVATEALARDVLESLDEESPAEESLDDLDSLLEEEPTEDDDLAGLLADDSGGDGLEALLTGEADETGDLDALLEEPSEEAPAAAPEPEVAAEAPAPEDPEFLEAESPSEESLDDLDSLLDEEAAEPEPDQQEDLIAEEPVASDDLDALLGDAPEPEVAAEAPPADDLESLEEESPAEEPLDDLDSLLEEEPTEDDDLAGLLDEPANSGSAGNLAEVAAEDDDLTALLDEAPAESVPEATEEDDLAALLADAPEEPAPEATENDNLAALLADVPAESTPESADDDLEALLTDEGGGLDDDLASLLEGETPEVNDTAAETQVPNQPETPTETPTETTAKTGDSAAAAPAVPAPAKAYEPNFGRFEGPQLDLRRGPNSPFRIALLGDFSGRANKGLLEKGDELAKRKGIRVEFDSLDEVIQRLGITLTLPIGAEGGAVEVPITCIDDFHPDDLCDNLEIFDELKGLRQRLQSSAGFELAAAEVQGWAQEGLALPKPEAARGTTLPATSKLEDFARLLGRPAVVDKAESSLAPMLRQMVAPHLVPDKDPRQDELVARVDQALSGTLHSVLHHPDFQTMEALWRSVDFLVRRIETSHQLQVVLYDISAEEFAADLSAHEDLSQSGLYRLLVEQPCLDENQGALSAVLAHYSLEMTPPHAELLARMGRIAAAGQAPFVTALSTDCLKLDFDELHPLVKSTWQALKAMPEATYLGVVLPRFLLRHPYGRKTEPIDSFDFEEFTLKMGLKAMLWANPVTAVATILGMSFAQNGAKLDLGSILSLGDMPFYYYEDADGDQMALPCTERLITERLAMTLTGQRIMPLLSIQGRPEIRLGSVNALAGVPLAGLWSDPSSLPKAPLPTPDRATATLMAGDLAGDSGGAEKAPAEAPAAPGSAAPLSAEPAEESGDLPDLDFDLDELPADGGDSDLDDLDALLDSLDLGDDATEGDDEMDPELAALLADL
jgi:type VI secretion system ImpB/VipA family protein